MSISFDQLYDDDKEIALGLFLVWANDFLLGFDLPGEANIDLNAASAFVSNLRKSDFPANGGYVKASPFKKAANAYVYMHAIDPFKQPIPSDIVGAPLSTIKTSTASFVGFAMVKSCLHGVSILRSDGQSVTLAQPLSVSKHFMLDLVEASSRITPETHYKGYSLLFEALAYEVNPGVCYPKVF